MIGCWYEHAIWPCPHTFGFEQSSSPTQMRQAGFAAINADALTVTPAGVMVVFQAAE